MRERRGGIYRNNARGIPVEGRRVGETSSRMSPRLERMRATFRRRPIQYLCPPPVKSPRKCQRAPRTEKGKVPTRFRDGPGLAELGEIKDVTCDA